MSNLLNLKSFFNFLLKNKAYTAIELFGLSVSLMFVILIGAYSVQELSVDRFHTNADRIYLLGGEEWMMMSYGIGSRVKEHFPEVEEEVSVCNSMVFSGTEDTPVTSEGRKVIAKMQFASDNFFSFFSFPLVEGNETQVMSDKNNVVISESFAQRMFPGESPIGKNIQLADTVWVSVSGVMKDINHSMIKYSDMIIPIVKLKEIAPWLDGNTFNNALSSTIFLLEREGTSLASKAENVRDYLKNDLKFWWFAEGLAKEVQFEPLTKAYFSDKKNYQADHGDKRLVMILLSVGILILLFAVINYINLSVAQTGFRAKEMATRQLLGSSRFDLFNRLMLESTLLTFISFGIGLLLAFAFLPYANSLLSTRIDLVELATWENITVVVLLILGIGLIAGLLPATLISRTKAVDVVKGAFRQKTKMIFSRFFITFQNAITIALIAASIIMVAQVDHLIKAPLGYRTSQLIDIPTMALKDMTAVSSLVNEMKQLGSVKQISLSAGTPFSGGNNNTMQFEDRNISLQVIRCDTAFMPMMGIKVIRENQVASGDVLYYLGEETLKQQNLPLDATTFRYYDRELPIAGVVKDFRLTNILREQDPIIVEVMKNCDYVWNILVEAEGDPFTAYQDVNAVYKRIVGLDSPAQFIDQQIQQSFAAQERTSKIVTLFCFVAIVLSFLGLLAMSTYFIQQRSREIGVRKVFGSTNREVLNRLVSTFLNYVLIAFVIATPIIWYIMRDWLTDYSYRITLTPWYFLLAGVGCLILSFLTVYWQSYCAANANPVKSIKAE